MAADFETIKSWFLDRRSRGVTHMLVVCDTFDHEDYPVYVKRGEDVSAKIREYDGANMQRVMEVYSYEKSWEEQAQGRVWNV